MTCHECGIDIPVMLKNYRCAGCHSLMIWTKTDMDFRSLTEQCGIDIINDNWPYGPNIDAHVRIALVNWAIDGGFVYRDTGVKCIHWILGQDCDDQVEPSMGDFNDKYPLKSYGDTMDRSSYEFYHNDAMRQGNWNDHMTCWEGPKGRFLLTQPYQTVNSLDLGYLPRFNIKPEIIDPSPWYGNNTIGVILQGNYGGTKQGNGGVLYRCFDKQERLLYIGESKTKIERIGNHNKDSWWKNTVRIEIEHFSTKQDAKRAETVAIRLEKPIYNVTHNRRIRGV